MALCYNLFIKQNLKIILAITDDQVAICIFVVYMIVYLLDCEVE